MAMPDIDQIKSTLSSWIAEGYSEGELSVEPEWYVLWPPESLEQYNEEYELAEYAPGYFTFGGNGGGELLVLNEDGEVFYIPAIGMAPDTAIRIARSLNEFKGYMNK